LRVFELTQRHGRDNEITEAKSGGSVADVDAALCHEGSAEPADENEDELDDVRTYLSRACFDSELWRGLEERLRRDLATLSVDPKLVLCFVNIVDQAECEDNPPHRPFSLSFQETMCRKLSEVAPLSPRARAEENLRRGLLSVYTTLVEIANASGRGAGGNALSDVHSLEEEKGSDAAFSEAVTWLRLRRGRHDKDGAGRCRSATPALPFGAFRRIFGNSFGKAGTGKISGVDWDSLFHSIRSRQVLANEPLAESVLRRTATSSLPLSLCNAGQDVASTADFTLPPWALDPLLSLLCAGLTHDLFSKRAARVALERIGLGGGITGFRKVIEI